MGVSGSRLDLEDAVLDAEERNVEGASSEVEDEDGLGLLFLFVNAVSNRRGGGLVDDSEHIEARDNAGIACRVTLGVVEIRRACNDGVGHLATEANLSNAFHLLEHHGGDLFGAKVLVLAIDSDSDQRFG